MSDAAQTLTAGRIRSELVEFERECAVIRAELERLAAAIDPVTRQALAKGLALDMHSLYTGIEHIFLLIARQVDGVEPSGMSWHRELLDQVIAGNPGVRPAVVSRETGAALEEMRRFRHVIRSVYSFDIDEARVLALAREVPSLCERLARELGSFADVLERCGTGE